MTLIVYFYLLLEFHRRFCQFLEEIKVRRKLSESNFKRDMEEVRAKGLNISNTNIGRSREVPVKENVKDRILI